MGMSISAVDSRPAGRSRQQHSERKPENVLAFVHDHPGATPPGHAHRDHADFTLSLQLYRLGHSEGEVRSKLRETVHAAERGADYIERTAANAKIAHKKNGGLKRAKANKLREKAERMAVLAFIAAGETPPGKRRDTLRNLRVLRALCLLACHSAEERGAGDFFAPLDFIRRMAGIHKREVITALKELSAKGLIRQTRAAGTFPDKTPARYEIGEPPRHWTKYERHPTKQPLRSLMECKNGTEKEYLDKNIKKVSTFSAKIALPISNIPLPGHPAFDMTPMAWFTWRTILERPDIRPMKLLSYLGVSRRTLFNHLRELKAAGLVSADEGHHLRATVPGIGAVEAQEPEAPAREEMQTVVGEFAANFGKPSDDTRQHEEAPDSPRELLDGMVSPRTREPVRFISKRGKLDMQQHELKKRMLLGDYVTDDAEELAYAGLATGTGG